MEGMVKVTGLWKQRDMNGQTFLSGRLSPISHVLVIPNADKKEADDPDYYMYLGANEQEGSPKFNPTTCREIEGEMMKAPLAGGTVLQDEDGLPIEVDEDVLEKLEELRGIF